jgi:hypothetical protein
VDTVAFPEGFAIDLTFVKADVVWFKLDKILGNTEIFVGDIVADVLGGINAV